MDSQHTLLQTPADATSSEQQPRRGPFRARRLQEHSERENGTLVLERYRLLERLGAGGFGVVWRAHDELLHREVAVKRIQLGPHGDSERAKREAHASARLQHPAIVALYEAYAQGEAFYLISELVRGQTLARLIAEDSLDDEEVLDIGLALIAALEHAHERGVVHRDIKPQNVLVPDQPGGADAPRAKLTDFGGASIAEEDALTRTGDVLGTLAYMAPEQSEGREIDEQADLYSLSLVLYEALSGVNPVRGATPAATAKRIGARLEPLARRRRDLPRELTGAIDRGLSAQPQARGTLEELRVGIEAGLEHDTPRTAPTRIRETRPHMPRPAAPSLDPAEPVAHTAEAPARALPAPAPQPGLPRLLWSGLGLALIVWQLATGGAGVALLLAAGLLALLAMPVEPYSRRVSVGWVAALLAPALGAIGLAGAFPALAGQAPRWRQRLALGAIGYWWLTLAGPLLGRRLWLAMPAAMPARSAWEGSLQSTATHVIGPLLTIGTLGGALLWGLAAMVLPLIVRGRRAPLDLLATSAWSALLVASLPRIAAGPGASSYPSPRGALLGAILGALAAIGARALRGPV